MLVAVACLASRLVVLLVFHLRGRPFPFMDAAGYLNQARWLVAHGSLSIPDADGGRFFHGMPLLLALLARITGEFTWTGLGLNAAAGLGAALLFYRNVGRLDWSVWHAILLPSWLASSATLHSEAGQWFFVLLGLTALRLDTTHRQRRLLLMVAGFAAVCRPMAVFIFLPFFAVWLLGDRRTWKDTLADAAAAAVFPVSMVIWALADTGHAFPESRWQAYEFALWSRRYGGFSDAVFSWPGHSFLVGFANPDVRFPVKVFNLLHFGAWAGGLVLAGRAWLRDRADRLAALIALELAVNGLFILTIGGPFGHTIYYRFLATQANVFVLWAWLRHTRIPAALWWTAGLGSVVLASLSSSGL